MNKKKLLALVLGAMLTAGVAFNFATTANYRENLGDATQTLSAGNWDVDMGNGLKSHTIFPGDVVGEDTITLENKNDYAVKYTVSLTTTGDTEFDGALDLDLLEGEDSKEIGRPNGTYEFFAAPKSKYVLTSKVTWTPSGVENKDITYQGKTVSYNYNIVSEAMPEIKNVVTVTSEDDVMKIFENLQPNTLVNFKAGDYTIGAESGIELPGIPTSGKRNLVLHQDGTRIVGEKGVVIKPLINVNGSWSHQSTILVIADNVTIEGITVEEHVNKTIEVVGDNVNIANNTINGTVYFNGDGPENIKKYSVVNNNINGPICITNGTGANGNKADMIIKDNTIDNRDEYLISLTGLRPTGWDLYKSGDPTIEGNTLVSNVDFLRISGEINGDRNGLLNSISELNTLQNRSGVKPNVNIVNIDKEYSGKPYVDSFLRVE